MNFYNRIELISKIVEKQKLLLDYKMLLKKVSKVKNTDFVNPLELSSGLPSLLILYQELEENYSLNLSDVKENLVQVLISNVKLIINDPSLFCGLSGLGFAIGYVNGEDRFSEVLDNFNKRIETLITERIERNNYKNSTNPLYYDVVLGNAGTARYLLDCNKEKNLRIIGKIVSEFDRAFNQGWIIPQQHQFLKVERDYFKKGNINFGIAHGLLGPMSVSALYYSLVSRNNSSIEKTKSNFNLLKKYAKKKQDFLTWPMRYDLKRNEGIYTLRNGWCYGDNGVYSTLYIMNKVLHSEEVENVLKGLQKAILNDDYEKMVSPTFCHGLAGKAAFLLLMYHHSKNTLFLQKAGEVIDKILEFYNDDNIFGFRDIEDSINDTGHNLTYWDNFGILSGTVGILLVLIEYKALVENVENLANWNKMFLII